jgi:hypothetical protein
MAKSEMPCTLVEKLVHTLQEGETIPPDETMRMKEERMIMLALNIHVLQGHFRRCDACGRKYALDVALIDAIRRGDKVVDPSAVLDAEHPSVAVEAVRIARARMKRLALLRWGGVAAVVSLVVAVMGSLGSGFSGILVDLLTAAVGTRPDLGIGRALLGVLVSVGEALRGVIFGGALARELAPFVPQIVVSAIGLGLVGVFLMYVMGLWLRKPGRVRS